MRLKDEAFYKAIRDFLNFYLVKQKNYSPNTQRSYREALNLLLLYFKTELGICNVEANFFEEAHHRCVPKCHIPAYFRNGVRRIY